MLYIGGCAFSSKVYSTSVLIPSLRLEDSLPCKNVQAYSHYVAWQRLVYDSRYGVMTMLFQRSEAIESASIHKLDADSLTTLEDGHHVGRSFQTENEQQQLAAWNETEQEYPTNACIPHLVAMQAASTPDAV